LFSINIINKRSVINNNLRTFFEEDFEIPDYISTSPHSVMLRSPKEFLWKKTYLSILQNPT